jgi:hypothetical protein
MMVGDDGGMTTRRDLLKGLLGAGVLGLAGLRAFAAARSFRLAFALTTGSSFSKGAALAFAEARQTAGLLGGRFELANPGANVFATVGELDPAGNLRGLFFTVGAPVGADLPVRPRIFHVAAGRRLRQRALSRQRGKGLRVVDWLPSLERFGAGELNQRYQRRFGTLMDEAAWHGWIAVKIAAELALRGAGANPAATLLNAGFDGHKGTLLRFDRQDHHLLQPVYLVDAKGKLVDEVEPEE